MTPAIVPTRDFTSSIFSFGLGLFDQVQATRAASKYTLSIGRFGGLDVSKIDASFESLFRIIDTWIEVKNRGARATFELENINGQVKANAHLSGIAQRDRHRKIIEDLQGAKTHVIKRLRDMHGR